MTDAATQGTSQNGNGANKKVSKTGWKNSRRHTITLPSSAEVDVEIPNLPQLIKTGQIPNNLVDAALDETDHAAHVIPVLRLPERSLSRGKLR